jgi:ABC-type branched-subunit amino acid transport system substrate-binding protein
MGSKEKLTELVGNMPEWQASALLMMTQAYLQAIKDAETKGRVDISSEVIKYLSEAGPTAGGGGYGRPVIAPPPITPITQAPPRG